MEHAAAEGTSARRRPPTRISFFGHFGSPNTGNESTLAAILARLRSLYPEADYCCICSHPDEVVRREGIDAVPISTRTLRLWNREAPLLRRLSTIPVGAVAELGQWVRATRVLEGSAMMIVPGTGLLTDAYGLLGWGPYNLLKWTVAARLRGGKVLFVSVGAGPLYSRRGRLCMKAALSLASYASFRDQASVRYLEGIGFRTKGYRVFPDLAFSLSPGDAVPDKGPPQEGRRRLVALGLMPYAERYSVENPDPATYPSYLDALVIFVDWLLARDYDVSLILGDADEMVVDDFTSLLQARVSAYSPERVTYQPTDSVQAILLALAESDVVVATRFHNVVLSLLLDKPVIAISFHHKCDSLMEQMHLSEYCQDIARLNPATLIGQFQALERNSAAMSKSIREAVEEQQTRLEEQYSLLFGRGRFDG
jgi:polysaccharide pyruvyl transferase WcaK-like protein